ncbi:hypothetical protein [Dactylosporangium sp. NPDC051541]|uniref:hypothetical protein n=1 Tax=Dactylosporangium sp. NPDC051541 TaxID=3363977 RepID=UPI0037933D19
MDESRVAANQLSGIDTPPSVEDTEAADTSAEEASPADVFEHLARIRSGISDGVVTFW